MSGLTCTCDHNPSPEDHRRECPCWLSSASLDREMFAHALDSAADADPDFERGPAMLAHSLIHGGTS